jgi:hypothetical protein
MGGEWIRQSTRRGRSVVDDRSLMNDLSSEECDEELAGIVGKFLLALGTSGMQLNLSACPGGGGAGGRSIGQSNVLVNSRA